MLVACTTCGRHHRDTDDTCPFCATRPSTTLRNTAAAAALGLSASCGWFYDGQQDYGTSSSYTPPDPTETAATGDTGDTAHVADTGDTNPSN